MGSLSLVRIDFLGFGSRHPLVELVDDLFHALMPEPFPIILGESWWACQSRGNYVTEFFNLVSVSPSIQCPLLTPSQERVTVWHGLIQRGMFSTLGHGIIGNNRR